MKVIEDVIKEGRKSLSEYESKLVLKEYSIPVTREVLVKEKEQLPEAIAQIGYPLVIKGCAPEITHKTELGLVFTDIRDEEEAYIAFERIYEKVKKIKNGGVLVQEMVKGKRELMVGMLRDEHFGVSVMFGLGGIFTEVLKDISFRIAPLSKTDAMEMVREIKASRILDSVRNMPAVDIDQLAELIVNVGRIGLENQEIKEMDINPIIISGSYPIAVDALIVLG
jgi:acetyl-CoA synthetase (ADP-forming)